MLGEGQDPGEKPPLLLKGIFSYILDNWVPFPEEVVEILGLLSVENPSDLGKERILVTQPWAPYSDVWLYSKC